MARLLPIALLLLTVALCGCVRRTITVISEPSGALVWLNDREVGRTPVTVEFEFYGTYDVRLEKEGYEPLQTSGEAKAPLWDIIGVDLVAEAMPGEPHSKVVWTYALTPRNDDETALLQRAAELRATALTQAATQSAATQPAATQGDPAASEPAATAPDPSAEQPG